MGRISERIVQYCSLTDGFKDNKKCLFARFSPKVQQAPSSSVRENTPPQQRVYFQRVCLIVAQLMAAGRELAQHFKQLTQEVNYLVCLHHADWSGVFCFEVVKKAFNHCKVAHASRVLNNFFF